MTTPLQLSILPNLLAVCRLEQTQAIPGWSIRGSFFSITRTDDELSIVCDQASVPPGTQVEDGWRALKVEGPLDFSLTGILAGLAGTLANAGISLFAISTYDTDYILVKGQHLEKTIAALEHAGHRAGYRA